MTSKNSQYLRPLKRDDLISFRGRVFDETIKGFTVIVDERIVCISGILYSKPKQLVSKIDDEMRKHPKLFIKSAKYIRELIKQFPPYTLIVAFADPKVNSSEEYLEYIGFEDTGADTEHGRLYKWQTQ